MDRMEADFGRPAPFVKVSSPVEISTTDAAIKASSHDFEQ